MVQSVDSSALQKGILVEWCVCTVSSVICGTLYKLWIVEAVVVEVVAVVVVVVSLRPPCLGLAAQSVPGPHRL